MSINLLITSSMYDKNSGKCFCPFSTLTSLANKEVALITGTFYNSFFNVASEFGNNQIVFKFPVFTGPNVMTMEDYVCTIDDGFYTIEELNKALQSFMIKHKLYLVSDTGSFVYFVDILVNSNRYKTQIDLYHIPSRYMLTSLGLSEPSGCTMVNPALTAIALVVAPQLDFTNDSGRILGIGADAVIPATVLSETTSTPPTAPALTYLSENVPDVQRVKAVVVRSNVVNSKWSNPVDQLALIPLSARFGANNVYTVPMALFCDVSNANYGGVQLSFCDQDMNTIKFRDPDMTFSLQIREKK